MRSWRIPLEDLSLTFYPTITVPALRERRTSELVVYAVAVALRVTPGDRAVPRDHLVAALRDLGIFRSEAHVNTLLDRGEGIFWDRLDADRVWLRGTPKVAAHFGAGRPAYRQIVSTSRLRTPAGRRAALLAVALPEDKPVSQRAIRGATGVSERTQYRYRKAGHFDAEPQVADLTEIADADLVQRFGQTSPELRHWWARQNECFGVFTTPGATKVLKHLPNIYSGQATRIRSGERTKDIFEAWNHPSDTDRTTTPRTLFDSAHQWLRCREPKLGTPPRHLPPATRLTSRTCAVAAVPGRL